MRTPHIKLQRCMMHRMMLLLASVSEQTTISGSIPDGTALITSDIDITISGPRPMTLSVYDHPAE